MSVHINDVLDYLEANPLRHYEGKLYPVLEMIHDAYTEQNAIDSEEIHDIFRTLDGMLENIPSSDAEELNARICDLCLQHEILAFSHGILVGMHLMTEINYLP